jgi:hypothetical protein
MARSRTWRLDFYNERRRLLARYGVEASLPAEAVLLGRKALLAEHPGTARRRRASLFERARRIEGDDAAGWVLYRIVGDGGHESPALAGVRAA